MQGRSQAAILALRQDGEIAREITALFMEKNAAILQKRGLPVTPTTLYLAHFAGPAGVSLYCQHLRMPMRPPLWPVPTQLAEPPAKRLLRPIHSCKILRLPILGVGPIARCDLLVPNWMFFWLSVWLAAWPERLHLMRAGKCTEDAGSGMLAVSALICGFRPLRIIHEGSNKDHVYSSKQHTSSTPQNTQPIDLRRQMPNGRVLPPRRLRRLLV